MTRFPRLALIAALATAPARGRARPSAHADRPRGLPEGERGRAAAGAAAVLRPDPVGQPQRLLRDLPPPALRAPRDGLSLGLGDGGVGLGPDRGADPANLPEQRVPRNAPGALQPRRAASSRVMFHDGRIEVDPSRPSGLRTPLEDEMVAGFANLLSAQTMFPVLSPDEMAGHYQENDVSKAVRQGRITGAGRRLGHHRAAGAADPGLPRGVRGGLPRDRRRAARSASPTSPTPSPPSSRLEWRADDEPLRRLPARRRPTCRPRRRRGGAVLRRGGLRGLPCRAVPDRPRLPRHGRAAARPRQGRAVREPPARRRPDAGDGPRPRTPTPSARPSCATSPDRALWARRRASTTCGPSCAAHADPAAALTPTTAVGGPAGVGRHGADWAILDDAAEAAAIAAAADDAPRGAGRRRDRRARWPSSAAWRTRCARARGGSAMPPDAVPAACRVDR